MSGSADRNRGSVHPVEGDQPLEQVLRHKGTGRVDGSVGKLAFGGSVSLRELVPEASAMAARIVAERKAAA